MRPSMDKSVPLSKPQGGNPSIPARRSRSWGACVGRALSMIAEWARWEAEIVAAGREGRIVGALHPVDGIPVTR